MASPEKLALAAGRMRQVSESSQVLLFVAQDREALSPRFGCGESPKGRRYLFTEEPDIECL